MRLPPPTEPSVNPPDYSDGDAPEPEALTMATVEEMVDEIDNDVAERLSGRVLDQHAEEIRDWLGPELRQRLLGCMGPARIWDREPDE